MMNFLRKFFRTIRRATLVIPYARFADGKRPIVVKITKDPIAERCSVNMDGYAIGTYRFICLNERNFMAKFDGIEHDKEGYFVGRYLINYSTQYISFQAYCIDT